MKPYQESRKFARGSPDSSDLGIIQSKGLVCSLGSLPKDFLYMYVEVKNCSDEGVLLDIPFKLTTDSIMNIALPDKASGQWKVRPAKVVWSQKTELSKTFYTGLQYLTDEIELNEELLWEVDPDKPSPEELSFFVKTGFFETISQVGVSLLLNSFQRVKVKAGERFICQGEAGDCLYLIQKGSCNVFYEKEGNQFQIAKLRAGDVVGEMSVLTGEPRAANVEAQTHMVLWRVASDVFECLANDYPDLRLFLTEIMSNRFDTSIFIGDRTVGKYLLNKKIGKGGWGIVYRGVHKLLKMPVAIKMMKHDMAMEPMFLAIFRREAETIARMRHPNIVSVYDIEEIYKTIFIIMEHLEGVSLKEMMKKVGPLPVERCVNILAQICDGLICAHSYDIVHRDIKPGNIFLLENDVVKLLDFGLACASGTEDMNVAGTVYYAPPEQIEGDPVDFRSDIYSLGIMAYEMVTGQRPFLEDNISKLMDFYCKYDIPDPAEIMPDLNYNVRQFIRNCTRCNPDERFQSVRHAKKELEKFNTQAFGSQGIEGKKERRVTSLLLFHTPEQQQDLKALLEEFGVKVSEIGIKFSMSEYSDTY
jgi:eukaryotic-like serine/threonine-protein kinase